MLTKLALTSAFVVGVSADLPLHCLIQDVVGRWKFKRGAASVGVPSKIRSCGHATPNNAVSMAKID